MKTILTVLAGLLGTGLLAYVCATGHRDLIQQDLSEKIKQALTESAVSDLRVSADGRDLTVHGMVLSPQAKIEAEEKARRIYGVRTVTNRLEVREAIAAPVPPPASIITAIPDTTPATPQPAVSPPTPAKSPKPKPAPPSVSSLPKSKPVAPQVPAKQESLAALAPATETRTLPARCEDALAAALGRRQVHFETNQSVIRPVSYPVLDRLAEAAKSCPAKKIRIGGHTDPRGEQQRNEALSQRRAQAVINYLVKKGVPAKRLTAAGFGSTKPVTSNATEAGRQRNRRVEFSINDP